MNNPTSIMAWHNIQDQLPKARATAYELVALNPDRTAVELEKISNNMHIHKRLPELQEMGAIYVPGLKTDPFSNQAAMFYRIVDPSTVSLKPFIQKVAPTKTKFFAVFDAWITNQSPDNWKSVLDVYNQLKGHP